MSGTPVVRGRGRPAAATRDEVLRAAGRRFVGGHRIDVQGVTADTGVARATVHRWFGTREGLIGETLVFLCRPLMDDARRLVHGRGGRGLLEAQEHIARELASNTGLRRFLEHERGAALRILTSSGGVLQPTWVAVMRELIVEEAGAGRYRPPADPDTLAYALVRMTEAFLYNDAAIGIRGDLDKLRLVHAALLGVSPG